MRSLRTIENVGIDPEADAAALADGSMTRDELEAECLRGVEDLGTEVDWQEYIAEVSIEAQRRRGGAAL
jgi:hypothetical protein